MQFFTMAWWHDCQTGDAANPFPDYARQLETIRDRLTPDLQVIAESTSLHDSQLRHIRALPAERTLTLELNRSDDHERLILHFSEVENFESTADPKTGFAAPAGFGDLGYCELDGLPNGAFEYRMLFSSGIEMAVQFRAFRLERVARVNG